MNKFLCHNELNEKDITHDEFEGKKSLLIRFEMKLLVTVLSV